MNRTSLILTDALLLIVLVTIYNTGDLKKYPVIPAPLIIIAFATCIIRHIHHYNLTKKIY
ncbi:MAG: hypothetical protein ACTHJ8_13180 [Mucilaginibacter sp.]